MPYNIIKHITQKKRNPFLVVVNTLLLIFAVPVVIIALISLIIFFIFMWLKTIFGTEKPSGNIDESYHLELELVDNEYVKIILIEDEQDLELTALNSEWTEKVYNKETCLYRAKTVPYIQGLDGRVCCFYVREQSNGVILQVIKTVADKPIEVLDTQLLFLQFPRLETFVIDEVGPYFLYNDKKDSNLIKGFNERETIIIELFNS